MTQPILTQPILTQPMQRPVQHGTFVVERTLPHPPARVFAAWSGIQAKSRWFGGTSEWQLMQRDFDFKAGGRERLTGRWTASGTVSDFAAHYLDIVPDLRIIYAYEMHMDGKKIPVSLATITFKPEGGGTKLTVTEQGAFLDSDDDGGSRETGTNWLEASLNAR